MKITIQNDAASDGSPILVYVRDQGKPTGKKYEVKPGEGYALELYDGAEVYFADFRPYEYGLDIATGEQTINSYKAPENPMPTWGENTSLNLDGTTSMNMTHWPSQ